MYLVVLSMSASLRRNLLQNIVFSCVIHVALWAHSAHLVSRMDKIQEPHIQVQSGEASDVFPSVLSTESGESAILGLGIMQRSPPLIRKLRKASSKVSKMHGMN